MVDAEKAVYSTFLGLIAAAAEGPVDGSSAYLFVSTGVAAQAFADFLNGNRTTPEIQRFNAWVQNAWATIDFASTDEAARYVAKNCLDSPDIRVPLLGAFKAQLDALSDNAIPAIGLLTADCLQGEQDKNFHSYTDILRSFRDEEFELFVGLVQCVTDAYDKGIIDGDRVDIWIHKTVEHRLGYSEAIKLVVLSNKDPHTCWVVGPDKGPLDIDLERAVSVLSLFKAARLGWDMTPTKHHTAASPTEALTIHLATAQKLARYLPCRPRTEH
jgi:hypothetical protein